MSQELSHDHVTKKPVLYRIAGMESASIRRDVEYRKTDAGPLTMDLYYPANSKTGARLPAVVFVHGYSDAGIGTPKVLDWPRFKEWELCRSWGQLVAASGLVAVTYTNRQPTADLLALLEHLRQNAAALYQAGDAAAADQALALWAQQVPGGAAQLAAVRTEMKLLVGRKD